MVYELDFSELKNHDINDSTQSISSYMISWRKLLLKWQVICEKSISELSNIWQILIYEPICILRSILRKYRFDSPKDHDTTTFSTFLDNLVLIQAIYRQLITYASSSTLELISNNPTIISQLLLNLGDVYRYEDDTKLVTLWNPSISEEELFRNSESCYLEAAYFCPNNGQIFNQLSIIHGNLRLSHHKNYPSIHVNYLKSLYFQLKSINSSIEFPQSKENWDNWIRKIQSIPRDNSTLISWLDSVILQCLFEFPDCSIRYSIPSIEDIIYLFSTIEMLMNHKHGLVHSVNHINSMIELAWSCLGQWIEHQSSDSFALSELLLFCFISQLLSSESDSNWIEMFRASNRNQIVLNHWCRILNRESSKIHNQGRIGNVLPMHKLASIYQEILTYKASDSMKYMFATNLKDSEIEYLWNIYLSAKLFRHSRQLGRKNNTSHSILFYHSKKKLFYPFVKRSIEVKQNPSQSSTAIISFDCEFLVDYFHIIKRLFSAQKYIIYIPSILMIQLEKRKRDHPKNTIEKIQFIQNRIRKPEKYQIILESSLVKTKAILPSNRISMISFTYRMYLQSYYEYITIHCPISLRSKAYFICQNEMLLSICADLSMIGVNSHEIKI